jgi:hypothetical protein
MLASAAILRFLSFDTYVVREREFLPAALEVTDTPPNPLGRLTVLALCLVALCGLGWAIFGKVDIVAVASGKIISHMRTQVVQPFETASVKAVLVGPGPALPCWRRPDRARQDVSARRARARPERPDRGKARRDAAGGVPRWRCERAV